MAYTALYRKFRPDNLDDVKGQDHIVRTLKNQIRAGRTGHAYLFCGTRGTGKTSVAKILAKAVNCEHPVDGNPCGECKSCKAIASGASLNVIEIDAASNNGVDNIREIREEVAYSPAEGKYKVYIIDEVHMLSTGAFNALLKTLEEPPSYVIFILATTEVNKIPITILSRCQRYDFHRIDQETILDRLKELAGHEQIEAEEEALRYIARKGDGSLRDSLSLMDQCIAFYYGEKLTYDRVLEVLGAIDTEVFSRLLRQIIKNDLVGAIRTIDDMIMQGKELGQLVTDFTWYMRNLMLVKASPDMENNLDVSTENMQKLREEADLIRQHTLMRYIRIFSELSGNIRYASNKRVLVEMAVIRLCRPEMDKDEASLLERIRRLESGVIVAAPQEGSDPYPQDSQGSDPYPENSQGSDPTPVAPRDMQKISSNWAAVISQVSQPFQATLRECAVPKFNASDAEDGRLYVSLKGFLAERYLGREEPKKELEAAIYERTGIQIEVKFVLEADLFAQKGRILPVEVDQIARDRINMDIEITEE